MVSENRDLLPQLVKAKVLSMFMGFNGISKNLLLFSERRPLPIVAPAVNII
jgi:hypothetical protein